MKKLEDTRWPEDAEGDRLARETRDECNHLTDSERKSLFEEGMRVIYGGDEQNPVSRH